MIHQQVIKNYNQACSLLHRRKVSQAIEILRSMVKASSKEFINEQLDELMATYRNILKHSFSAVKDPRREEVYHYLIRTLLELADELRELLLTDLAATNIYRMKHHLEREKRMERKEALALLESLTFDRELQGLLRDVNVENSQELTSREEALTRVFNIIWLTDKYTDAEIELLKAASTSRQLPWHDKALIVSALTISLLRYFDVNKFRLLFLFVSQKQQRVWERAMVGLFVCFLKYNDRYYLYPVLEEKTRELADFPNIQQNIEGILVQFTKSKETEKVRKKWEEEIMPAMMKMRPRIEEKLDLDNIFKEETGEEKNPDWETMFEDVPDLLDKLTELTEMQLEGMDVYISAFAQLKQFPFFREISNWLVPFYTDNQVLAPMIKDPEHNLDLTPLFEKLENTYFMCNSDKYSFCLNMNMVPHQQKAMMMNMLNEEMKNISEIQNDEKLLNSFSTTKSIYTQYFQDLYRFFRLHPWHNEFDDIFSMKLDLYETFFVKHLVSDHKTIRNIAEFYFDKKFYADALKIFSTIVEKEPDNLELVEKIAFCYEKSGDFSHALEYYKKADLIESDRPWITRKMALCSKYLNQWEQALGYYRQVEKSHPDDLKVQANIGQCLIHLERFGEALDYYFKVEVLAPENHKIRRPLAWCSFLVNKLDTAKDYLERLLASEAGNRYDLMNMGHVYWAMNQPGEAFGHYRQSLAQAKDLSEFENAFNEDRKHLKKYEISDFEMDLMLEYIRLESQ
ncbi:MAG: tetratricopeptide repeat protein [Bacteroidales bacterium]